MAKRPKTTTSDKVRERVLKKIKPASELEDWLRILIYGRSGSKKTRTAASAPHVIMIDINEKGTKSVRDTDPNVYPVLYWTDLNDIFWYLQEGDHDYETYAIDGVTSMQNLCIKFVLGDEAARDASRDPDMPSRVVWGKVGELMKTQITNFRNLPMNGVFTALQRSRSVGEDADEEEMVISPNCSPSVAGHLEAAVDIIGHLSTREVMVKQKAKKGEKRPKARRSHQTRLLVGPSERYITKDRTGMLGDLVKRPNIAEIIEITRSKEA